MIAATQQSTPASTAADRAIAGRRIYFAHQSVGNDIMRGVEAVMKDKPDVSLKIVDTRDPTVLYSGPAFVHWRVGRNQDPASKNADFLRVLDATPDVDGAIAVLKYCYVDVNNSKSAKDIFNEYQQTVAAVRARHPRLTLVHMTMPLASIQEGPRARVKELLGRDLGRGEAIKRHEFNTMIRTSYAGREPLFDIADIEWRRADGSRSYFVANGDTIPSLAWEYTWDGGHLKDPAARAVARGLLDVLGSVAVAR